MAGRALTNPQGKHNVYMASPANNAIMSPNFAFLIQYDEVLVRHAVLAERYVFDDPNSALIKLRQFGELLAQHAAAYTGIIIEEPTFKEWGFARRFSMQ